MVEEIKDTEAPKKSDAELYLELSQQMDITVPSGAVFRIRPCLNREYGEVLGGIPAMLPPTNGTKQDPDERRRLYNEAHEKAVYERFVEGIVDRTTGKVTKIPFDSVLAQDAHTLGMAVMNGGGLDSARAKQIRRSL